jgi:hypothetical protein
VLKSIEVLSSKNKHREVVQVTSDIIRRFNRDTGLVATGILGVVVSAALLLAVQERHPSTGEAVQAGTDIFLNANPATMGSVVANSSSGKMPSDSGSSVDGVLTKSSAEENSVLASPAEVNHRDALADTRASSPQASQNSVRVIRSKVRKARDRSSSLLRSVDVKRRLIALWHQSLAQSEKSRSWTAFSSLGGGIRKKAAYTTETNR